MRGARVLHASRSARAPRALAILALAGALAVSALALAHQGMHETIERLTHEISEHPTDARLYHERGVAYMNDGKLEPARADLQRAAELGDPAAVAYDLGVLFYRAGEYAQARESLTAHLAQSPGDPRAFDYRARAAREAGDVRAAIADFEALFASASGVNPGHYVSAAELVAKLEDGGIASALALLDAGIAKLGVIPQLQRPAIAFERERGDLSAALRRLETLAVPLGRNPEWRIERAELLHALRREDESRAELEDAARALDAAKPTPARAELKRRAEALRAQLTN